MPWPHKRPDARTSYGENRARRNVLVLTITMDTDADILAIAKQFAAFAICASAIMQRRLDNHVHDDDTDDTEGAQVWQRVINAVRELLSLS